jgi:hypothetical protein
MVEQVPNAANAYVDAVVRLQNAYLLERRVFLGGVIVSILLLTFFSIMAAFGFIKQVDWKVLFGPGGLFLGVSTGAMLYFGKSLDAVKELAGGTNAK